MQGVYVCLFVFSFQNQYNLARAQQSYKSLVQIHEKNGMYIRATLFLSAEQPGNWYLATVKLEVPENLMLAWEDHKGLILHRGDNGA